MVCFLFELVMLCDNKVKYGPIKQLHGVMPSEKHVAQMVNINLLGTTNLDDLTAKFHTIQPGRGPSSRICFWSDCGRWVGLLRMHIRTRISESELASDGITDGIRSYLGLLEDRAVTASSFSTASANSHDVPSPGEVTSQASLTITLATISKWASQVADPGPTSKSADQHVPSTSDPSLYELEVPSPVKLSWMGYLIPVGDCPSPDLPPSTPPPWPYALSPINGSGASPSSIATSDGSEPSNHDESLNAGPSCRISNAVKNDMSTSQTFATGRRVSRYHEFFTSHPLYKDSYRPSSKPLSHPLSRGSGFFDSRRKLEHYYQNVHNIHEWMHGQSFARLPCAKPPGGQPVANRLRRPSDIRKVDPSLQKWLDAKKFWTADAETKPTTKAKNGIWPSRLLLLEYL